MKKNRKKQKFLICLLIALAATIGLCSCKDAEKSYITSIDEVQGKTIAVISGTTQVDLVARDDRFKDCTVIQVANFDSGLALLEDGKVNAVIMDGITVEAAVKTHDEFKLLSDKLGESCYAAVFPKGSSLIPDFNNALSKLKQDGTIDALKEKWLVEDYKSVSVIEQTWPGNNGSLVCLNDADGATMGFKDANGNFQGLDIDIALAIAKAMDYKIEFRLSHFNDILPSIMKEQADFAMSSIDYTEERAARVDFSDGYLDNATRIIVRAATTEEGGLWHDFKQAINDIFLQPGRGKLLFGAFLLTNEVYFLTMIFSVLFGFGLFLLFLHREKMASAHYRFYIQHTYVHAGVFMAVGMFLRILCRQYRKGNSGNYICSYRIVRTCMLQGYKRSCGQR